MRRRVQRTLLEEFYQPTLIGYTEPSITGLRRDLNASGEGARRARGAPD